MVLLAVAKPMSHFSNGVSGETLFLRAEDMELMFNFSSNDDVNASILTVGSGVVVMFDRFGGRGTLIPNTFLLHFFLFLISPFQLVMSFSCSVYIGELGSQSR